MVLERSKTSFLKTEKHVDSRIGGKDKSSFTLHAKKKMAIQSMYLTKHRILLTSVLSADKTLHSNKKSIYRYKVTACDVLMTI